MGNGRRWSLRALAGCVLAVAALASSPRAVDAQVTRADSAAVLLETARSFEAQGRWDVAEPLLRFIVERFPGTPAAAEAQARLGGPRAEPLGDGRVELQVWSTLYGAWLGIAVPGAFGADSNEPYGVGLLVGTPAGFFAGRAIGRATGLTEGQASIVSLGAWWGTWQGFGWREVFDLGVVEQCDALPGLPEDCYSVEDTQEENFAAMILGGAAGIATAALLADRDITPGEGTLVNFGALWGTWFGVAGGVLLDLEGDDLLAATLVGGNVGLVSAALLAPRWNVTRSRARLVSIAGVLGGLAGAGVDLLIEPDDEKVAIAIPLVGSVAGLLIGAGATGDDAAGGSGAGADRAGPGARPFAPRTSFVDVRDGTISLGAPLPTPTWLPMDEPERTVWRPALRLELLRARF